jgi:hypothetical protein
LQLATIPGTPHRLHPPRELDATERKIFIDLISATRPEHFRDSDLPLICAYVRAIALERRSAAALAKGDNKALLPWTQAVKALVALSMRLRTSPQAREPHRPTRPQPQPRPHTAPSYYERARLEEGDA